MEYEIYFYTFMYMKMPNIYLHIHIRYSKYYNKILL